MTGGPIHYTDCCRGPSSAEPGYVSKGDMVDRYWDYIGEGGEVDFCRE